MKVQVWAPRIQRSVGATSVALIKEGKPGEFRVTLTWADKEYTKHFTYEYVFGPNPGPNVHAWAQQRRTCDMTKEIIAEVLRDRGVILAAMDITMTLEEYETLYALALKGANCEVEFQPASPQVLQIANMVARIDARNEITHYMVYVRWAEADSVMRGVDFPEVWPPNMQQKVEQTGRPIARADVDRMLKVKARKPYNVLVTTDPRGLLGWTDINVFFKLRHTASCVPRRACVCLASCSQHSCGRHQEDGHHRL